MTLSTEDLFDKALHMAGNVEDNFLELGKALSQLQDRDLELFQKIVAKGSLRRRKADRKSTRLNSSHPSKSRMPSSA